MWIENKEIYGDNIELYLKTLSKSILSKIEFTPPKEKIDQDTKKIKEKMINEWDPEKRGQYEKYEVFYAWLYNWTFIYWILNENKDTVLWYYKDNWEFLFNVKNVRNRFKWWEQLREIVVNQRYNSILNNLWYSQHKDDTWRMILYKRLDNWELIEIKEKTKEFFDVMIKSQEMEELIDLKWSIKRPEKWKNVQDFIEDWIFYWIISFKDIEILFQNEMLNKEQFEYIKWKIPNFFFKQIYTWLVDKKGLEDAKNKWYISDELYTKCLNFLNSWKISE